LLFDGKAEFQINGTIEITNCRWILSGGDNFNHFFINGDSGKFKCSNLTVVEFNIVNFEFIKCNNNAILDSCSGLEMLGASSTEKSIIKLGGGSSDISHSVFFFFYEVI
jgi:hypothetical protein